MSKSFFRTFKSFSVLKPFIDYEERLKYSDALKRNVSRRKLDVNVDQIFNFSENLKRLKLAKTKLEASREAIRLDVSRLGADNNNETTRLKSVAKMIREDYRQVRSSVLDLEEKLILLMNQLPNDLHWKTPDENQITFATDVPKDSESHLDIGRKKNLLEYRSALAYFLKNEAAELEANGVSSLVDELKSKNFVGFSNPDFSRTIVLEGCEGANVNCILLNKFEGQQDELYLTGGAAVLPFLCYFARSVVSEEDLPVRCYSYGRQYSQIRATHNCGLFRAAQTNALEVFVLSSAVSEEEELNNLVTILTEFYKTLDVPFRVVVKRASDLNVAESLKVSFELYSPHFKEFYECGYICTYGSYLSKMMNIRLDNQHDSFHHIVSGTAVRITPLIAALLESNKFS